jgi:alpha-glucuronidase
MIPHPAPRRHPVESSARVSQLPAPYLRFAIVLACVLCAARTASAEDGYELWLRYPVVTNAALLAQYRTEITGVLVTGTSRTAAAIRDELDRGLRGLLGRPVPAVTVARNGVLIAGTPASSPFVAGLGLSADLARVGGEGYVIRTIATGRGIVIAANTDVGVLYGTFAFLRLLQTHRPIAPLSIVEAPALRHRILNHWDNLDGSVERGYAGSSLWDWHTLPDYRAARYTDYARANASLGINGTVLTNVNANAASLTPEYIAKAAALADVFRPYGIRVYLTARFSAPIEIGGLKTADPLAADVRAWWRRQIESIYTAIPDFGGFLVKANSEGQPGPQDYGRTHADGANMLADALAPQGGLVVWRAFVYSETDTDDRARQAFKEFVPLDGTFRANVLLQIKNGPIDFQPREPFHPLFGALARTPMQLELQITKEYLGFATHLVYLAPLFEEVLAVDTRVNGSGPLVREVLQGAAGVANTGTSRNWCGAVFACANWHGFGRLAWNPRLTSAALAEEWLRATFTNDPAFVEPVTAMMLASRQAAVDYMTPLGLHHLMARGHHYGPGPWVDGGPRADWTSVYYHRADATGLGFDRTATGSNAVAQYAPGWRDEFGRLDRVPDDYLLWFHHVPWGHRMASGRTLWNELTSRYCRGVETVRAMQASWRAQAGRVDTERFDETRAFLDIQEKEARWWRDASVLYFQTFARQPIASDSCGAPAHGLDYYRGIVSRNVPGSGN